ncbi:MAG: hypothetical protein V3W20_10585 [Candidatus Neomarinimicrobiota bacterium]
MADRNLCRQPGITNVSLLAANMLAGADCDKGLGSIDEGISTCDVNCAIAGMSTSDIVRSLFTTDSNGDLVMRIHFQAAITDIDRCQQPNKRPVDNCLWEDAFFNNIGMSASLTAVGILTLSANLSDTETITLGLKTYTAQTVLTDVDGNFLIGATASDTIDNLIAAITLGAGVGVVYATSTTANTQATAAVGAGDTMGASALLPTDEGNSIVTTETSATASWAAATLLGGQTARPTLIITQSS